MRLTKSGRKLVKTIRAMTDQFTIEPTGKGHIKLTFENTGKATAIFPLTPSDHRTVKNCMSDARRAMVKAGVEMKGA